MESWSPGVLLYFLFDTCFWSCCTGSALSKMDLEGVIGQSSCRKNDIGLELLIFGTVGRNRSRMPTSSQTYRVPNRFQSSAATSFELDFGSPGSFFHGFSASPLHKDGRTDGHFWHSRQIKNVEHASYKTCNGHIGHGLRLWFRSFSCVSTQRGPWITEDTVLLPPGPDSKGAGPGTTFGMILARDGMAICPPYMGGRISCLSQKMETYLTSLLWGMYCQLCSESRGGLLVLELGISTTCVKEKKVNNICPWSFMWDINCERYIKILQPILSRYAGLCTLYTPCSPNLGNRCSGRVLLLAHVEHVGSHVSWPHFDAFCMGY